MPVSVSRPTTSPTAVPTKISGWMPVTSAAAIPSQCPTIRRLPSRSTSWVSRFLPSRPCTMTAVSRTSVMPSLLRAFHHDPRLVGLELVVEGNRDQVDGLRRSPVRSFPVPRGSGPARLSRPARPDDRHDPDHGRNTVITTAATTRACLPDCDLPRLRSGEVSRVRMVLPECDQRAEGADDEERQAEVAR